MSFLHLLWIVPLSAFLGFQIGSIVEYLFGYNFADEEKDLLQKLYAKASAEEKAVLGKIAAVRKAL